jgi:cell division protein FtsL
LIEQISHQAETLATQLETIAQLRREVSQWKDQSRNWQEHFLRVEQERCSQASRIDELVVEKLQVCVALTA